MKKVLMTFVIVLGLSMTTFAQNGGLFQRGGGNQEFVGNRNDTPLLPGHGSGVDGDATPLGTGIMMLTAFGAAYLVGKKRKND